jgi:hypothetical protein
MLTSPSIAARVVQRGPPESETTAPGTLQPSRGAFLTREAQVHIISCTTLFAVALAYRLRELGAPLYGDQALYFYLSQTLGFAPGALRDLGSLWTHFAVRPFMYLFFWPWANLGMTSFRLANIIVGAGVPCLLYALIIRFRVRPGLAAIVALTASVHPVLVSFSGRCFPDNLATALVLSGYLAYFCDRAALATATLLLTVLSKEAYAMFLLPLAADGAYRLIKTRSHIVLAPLLGFGAVVITTVLSIYVFDGRLQGWGSGKPDAAFFKGFLASGWFIPLYVLLLLEGQINALLIGLAAPTFFIVWGHVLHRGVEVWYLYGPFCMALVALAVGLQTAIGSVAVPIEHGPAVSRFAWLRRTISQSCALALVATIVVLPEQAGWRSWLDLVRIDQLLDAGPRASADPVEQMATYVRHQRPKELLIMDSFWAYAYYPFGTTADHIWKYYSTDNSDTGSKNQFGALIRKHDYVLTGDPTNTSAQARAFHSAFRSCELNTIGKFTLYAVAPDCLALLGN